jgi:dTDP-4-dehydrorhamnose reductase
VLGSTGLLGSKVSSILAENSQIDLITTSRNDEKSSLKFNPISNNLNLLLDETYPDYVVNCIGVIPQGRRRSIKNYIEMFQINTSFSRRLAQAAKAREIRVIHPLTDGVFSGRRGGYSENSAKCPKSVYALSKMLGETRLEGQIGLRCSLIGPEISGNPKSIFSWVLSHPSNAKILGFTNQWWNGVTTSIFARICEYLIVENLKIPNTLHLIPNNSVSKFELLELIAKYNSRNDLSISPYVSKKNQDLRLTSIYEDSNISLWRGIGFTSAPTIEEMIALN